MKIYTGEGTIGAAKITGLHLRVWNEPTVTTAVVPHWEPDPIWATQDSEGHSHSWSPAGYTTLKWVSSGCTQGHGSSCVFEGHYECVHCGSRIEPAAQYITQPREINSYREVWEGEGDWRGGELNPGEVETFTLTTPEGTLTGKVRTKWMQESEAKTFWETTGRIHIHFQGVSPLHREKA